MSVLKRGQTFTGSKIKKDLEHKTLLSFYITIRIKVGEIPLEEESSHK
jgi:hypothetical protein